MGICLVFRPQYVGNANIVIVIARKTAAVLLAAVLLMVPSVSTDAIEWPADGDWVALPCPPPGTSPQYQELHDDFQGSAGQHQLDIVGDSTYAAGFKASTADHLVFRMRVDQWG